MSRDYKKSSRSSSSKGGRPMLTGVLIGVFVGVGMALVVAVFVTKYFNSVPHPTEGRKVPAPEAPAILESGKKPASAPTTPNAQPPEKPRFDFYKILPGKEEAVTDQDLKAATQQAQSQGVKDQYFLQVGAFQKESEADNLKAKLALLGVEATIQTTALPDKGVLHRVRVGPFGTIDEMNRARTTLAQNGYEPSLIKIRGDNGSTH